MWFKRFIGSSFAGRSLVITGLLALTGIAQAQTISTVAGTGTGTANTPISSCGSGAATQVNLEYGGNDIAVDSQGNLYIAESNVICKVDTTGSITTFAGNGSAGNSGDGGPATSASFSDITGLAFDNAGNLYVGSMAGGIRKIDASGTVTLFSDLNGRTPFGIAVDSSGNLYTSLAFQHLVVKVDSGGAITTVAGVGSAGYSGDGGAATSAALNFPTGLAFDAAGHLHMADVQNRVVRKIDAGGIISSVPGANFSNDMGTSRYSSGLAFDRIGNLYISNGQDNNVLKVDANGGNTVVAGTGAAGYSGDGGPATSAQLRGASAVAFNSAGALFISDAYNRVVRKVVFSDLVMAVALPGSTAVGMPYSGTVTITNNGSGPADAAASVSITGLPNGLTLGSCNVAHLAAGASVTCSVNGTATTAGSFAVTAAATDTADLDPRNNSATATIAVGAFPDLAVSTNLPAGTVGTAYSGSITITNSGTAPASASAAASVTGLPAGLVLGACDIANLAAGGSVTCAITGTPTAAGSFAATAAVTDSTDSNTANNTALATLTIVGGVPVNAVATPVPTLGQWGSILLVLLMLMAGGWRARRPAQRVPVPPAS